MIIINQHICFCYLCIVVLKLIIRIIIIDNQYVETICSVIIIYSVSLIVIIIISYS